MGTTPREPILLLAAQMNKGFRWLHRRYWVGVTMDELPPGADLALPHGERVQTHRCLHPSGELDARGLRLRVKALGDSSPVPVAAQITAGSQGLWWGTGMARLTSCARSSRPARQAMQSRRLREADPTGPAR